MLRNLYFSLILLIMAYKIDVVFIEHSNDYIFRFGIYPRCEIMFTDSILFCPVYPYSLVSSAFRSSVYTGLKPMLGMFLRRTLTKINRSSLDSLDNAR